MNDYSQYHSEIPFEKIWCGIRSDSFESSIKGGENQVLISLILAWFGIDNLILLEN